MKVKVNIIDRTHLFRTKLGSYIIYLIVVQVLNLCGRFEFSPVLSISLNLKVTF